MGRKDCGLTKVPRINRPRRSHESWSFSEGTVRKAFERIFEKNAEYVLFQTIANEKAATALEKYIAFRDDMESPWQVREIEEGDTPVYVPGARNTGNGLQFSNSLMDVYMQAIEMLSGGIRKEDYANYPLVKTNGVHNHDRDPNAIYWPQIFIVNTEEEQRLKDIIDNLSEKGNDEGLFEELQAPQFYQMAEIETLHHLGIDPLKRLPGEIRAGAEELGQYVDFLTQMTESYKWTGPVTRLD